MKKLNLGCGKDYRSGWINVDKSSLFKVDYNFDLEKLWPFQAGTIDEIYCSHILEHIKDLVGFMNEASRVLKKGGKLEILVPHYGHPWAYGDPSHIRFMSDESIFPFSTNANDYRHLGITCSFKLLKTEIIIDQPRKIPGVIHWILKT
ncbi:hypothetical protein ES707_08084 [subsurface metagenome]